MSLSFILPDSNVKPNVLWGSVFPSAFLHVSINITIQNSKGSFLAIMYN